MLEITQTTNKGFINEEKIIRSINEKKVKDVNILFQELFFGFFKNINENDIIKAYKGNEKEKTDIIVKINSQQMNISVKMGFRNSVHCENIYYFLKFLKELKIPYEIINKYLLYHYADGTMNGTGENRISVAEYKKSHIKEIDLVNKYFNNVDFTKSIANKFLFKGNQSDYNLVDIILWGTSDDFLWVTRDEVIEYLKTTFSLYSTGIHFGRLSVQPANRCLNRNPREERRRKQVEIKWYNIFDSIIEILNNREIKNGLE